MNTYKRSGFNVIDCNLKEYFGIQENFTDSQTNGPTHGNDNSSILPSSIYLLELERLFVLILEVT